MKTKINLANLKKMAQAEYLNEIKDEFKRLKTAGQSEVIIITDFIFADGKKGSVLVPTDISGVSQKFYNDVAKKEYKGFGRGTVNLKDGEQGATMELYIDSGKAKAKTLEKGGKKIFEKVGVIPMISKNPAALAEEEPDAAEENAPESEAAKVAAANPQKLVSPNPPSQAKTGADGLKEIQALVKNELAAIAAKVKAKQVTQADAEQIAAAQKKVNGWLDWFKGLGKNEQKPFEPYVPQIEVIKKQIDTMGLTASNLLGKVVATIVASVGKGGKNVPADVKLVQELLNKKGAKLVADGGAGAKTVAAIVEFQKKSGLKTLDGLISPNGATWQKLTETKIDDAVGQMKADKYNYGEIALKLFEKGKLDAADIDPNDVEQGAIGDCYFMSAIAAVAQANPQAIKNLIKDNGDGSYDVTLYSKKDKLSLTPTIVKVKPQFPVDAAGKPVYAGAGDKEVWVMIMEKAYAKLNGTYNDIGEGGYIEEGLEAITGKEAANYWLSEYKDKDLVALIQKTLADKKPITAATKGGGEEPFKSKSGCTVYKGHAYSITSVDATRIKLQNPWGFDHVDITIGEFKEYYDILSF